ncbi:MAG: DUF1653 domain-containing protein [Lachnospiraceae bacterium]|nr:DUF1653 domain-containing protein [Lachnospiraceae bacterium]
MRDMPRPYERYRHFKGKEYQVLLLAVDAGTGRQSVVYQGLYEPFQIYVRDLEEFMSEVDHQKYPDAVQKKRFQLLEKKDTPVPAEEPAVKTERANTGARNDPGPKPVKAEATKVSETEPKESGTEGVNPVLSAFLDAQTVEEQLEVLRKGQYSLTEKDLTLMELWLDIRSQEGTPEERCRYIRMVLQERKKYQHGR